MLQIEHFDHRHVQLWCSELKQGQVAVGMCALWQTAIPHESSMT